MLWIYDTAHGYNFKTDLWYKNWYFDTIYNEIRKLFYVQDKIVYHLGGFHPEMIIIYVIDRLVCVMGIVNEEDLGGCYRTH